MNSVHNSRRTAARILLLLACVSFLHSGISLYYSISDRSLLRQMASGVLFPDYESRQLVIGIISIVTGLLWVVIFGLWLYKANKSLREMGVQGLQYGPGWGIGGFLVPFLQFVRPAQVTQEIWKASDPDIGADDPTEWILNSASPLIGVWWGLVIVSKLIVRFFVRDVTVANALEINTYILAAQLFEALAAFAAIAVVLKVEDRLVRKEQAVAEREELRTGDDLFTVMST